MFLSLLFSLPLYEIKVLLLGLDIQYECLKPTDFMTNDKIIMLGQALS